MEWPETCFLCGELKHHGGRIAVIEDFQVVSDIAPLSNGHILMASIEHQYSYGMLQLGRLDRIEKLTKSVEKIFQRAYGARTILFEHGMGNGCDLPACGIDHCHLHALPVLSSDVFFGQHLIDFLHDLELEVEFAELQHYQDLKKVEGRNYLFTQDVDGAKGVITTLHSFPGQVIRRYVATRLGSPYTYDWQVFYKTQAAQNTTKFLREIFQQFLLTND